ncbi:MAG: arginine--tRNA ligase [Eubacterium sp.]|nr:arginine--tRNA ligase [Eubacterium sp.]
MEKIIDLINNEMAAAFDKCGYDKAAAVVSVSNRPDLCEYQCNGAMRLAKALGKAPIEIASDVAGVLSDSTVFETAEAVKPGFINLNLSGSFLSDYIKRMAADSSCGAIKEENPEKIIIDYGGPNVAKPLHVGHLRSAVIGEAIKRMGRFCGNEVIGDVHMGDWGLQMGLIICQCQDKGIDPVYYDEDYQGEYPSEAPFTAAELEEIYPAASARSKEDAAFHDRALKATAELQSGRRGYNALLSHILEVSVADMKKNYERLNVDFDLWLGESDAQKYVPDMLKKMEDDGYAHEDQGALVVDVAEESDSKEIPPCIVRKSDGASLYATTDLATLVQRVNDYDPDHVIYVVDKRQQMHFTQVFRAAKKCGIVSPDMKLDFLGFGTMNGKDGQPFKTREGGVMKLSVLIDEIDEAMKEKILDNKKEQNADIDEEEVVKTARTVALAALKYGDLSNQATKNYIFDIDRFTSFEGNTGPYILYTIVRIKSILRKYQAEGGAVDPSCILEPADANEKALMNELTGFNGVMLTAFRELAPHKICSFVYSLSNAFNHFYHETKIMGQEDKARQSSQIALLDLTRRVLESCIDVLGFSAPEYM